MVGRRFAKRKKADGKDVTIKAHQIVIPARPYLGMSAQDEEAILEIAKEWLIDVHGDEVEAWLSSLARNP